MKKYFLPAIVAITLVANYFIIGCGGARSDGPVTEMTKTEKVLATTDSIYKDVRIVVTDPEVKPLFSEKELSRLAELEKKYLVLSDTLRKFPNDGETIEKLSWLAMEILIVLDDVEYIEKYRPYIAAIRISIKLLRNHI